MNYFSQNPLNRFSELRPDEARIRQFWQQENVAVLVVNDSSNLFTDTDQVVMPATLNAEQSARLQKTAHTCVYLGTVDNVPYFVLGFEAMEEQLNNDLGSSFQFLDLKGVALELPQEQSSILAYARGIVHWNMRHRHCPDCGSLTASLEAGHVRQCSNSTCGKLHFPRTDAAVIMLISEGDSCLLGRQAGWPKGQYATLAGFLEPGETLEQAVAREAKEETGVALKHINYHSSQPWPFPGSIMIGFTAVAQNRNLQVNYNEMEDARWFTREEIIAGLRAGTFRLPTKVSISYRLIRDWFNAMPGYDLEEVQAQAVSQ
ncbi:NAD(+) diphosphatase [Pontibacter sp. MBLB2868]|uniref:NAD(+) diphosphatase n=1 Tax=Pontibacter sp. MBLB2868 TaxID=3451555 RepID=UPI003F756513